MKTPLSSSWANWRERREGRGARLTRRAREEYLVYFDRSATMSDAKRQFSRWGGDPAGMHRHSNAARVCSRAAQRAALAALFICAFAVPAAATAGESPPPAAVTSAELESEIRSELDSLKERIEDLEMLLATLVTTRGAEAAARTGETSLVLAAANGGTSAAPDLPVPAAAAQDSDSGMPEGVASTGGQPLSITGLLDTYYTHNANDPQDGNNTLYYTNPNARGFGLNQLKLEIETAGDGPFGFRSDLWFGSGARLFRDGLEPGPLADVLYLQQAFGYYRFGNGAQLDVGLFGTIAGLEVAESHLNWNYTRGILWAWNEPFSHLGARLGVPLSETFTGTLLLVNGFDNAWDQNTGKSYGLQGSLAPSDQFNTTLTWINGPENAGTNDGWVRDLSWNAYVGLTDRVEAMVNMDYISATDEMGASATSWGLGGYLRFHVNDRVRIAERYEFMNDREARSTGLEQMLMENTLTLEFQPVVDDPRFLTRFEYRRDWSDADFFSCSGCGEGLSKSQDTFTIGMSWVFGPR